MVGDNKERQVVLMDENLIQEALKVRERAYTPYSNFDVGAVLLTTDGVIFEGCNIENSSYGLTSCAERNAIFAAVTAGYHHFSKLVVIGDTKDVTIPCGACLQVMSEFFDSDMQIILANINGLQKSYRFQELFPASFNLRDDRRV